MVEAAFANALDVRVGDPVTLRSSASRSPPPCRPIRRRPAFSLPCRFLPTSWPTPNYLRDGARSRPGLAHRGGCAEPHPDPDSLGLRDEPEAGGPGECPGVRRRKPGGEPGGAKPAAPTSSKRPPSWPDAQILLLIGAWLFGLLAVASLSVLVGGRMADQTRRVGLLKAVGGTPSLVAAVLLAEYVLVAIVAAAVGGRIADRSVAHRVPVPASSAARARRR